jgi:ferredoxin
VIREIVTIDEELCDGCGLCIPACHEGALRLVDGKAKLVSDQVCDGLGACLGHCPRGAIQIERREADPFDEEAVTAQAAAAASESDSSTPPACPSARVAAVQPAESDRPQPDGCPGARFAQFSREEGVSGAAPAATRHAPPGPPSTLTHWPVQLRLLPAQAPVLRGARLLVAADCVPVAYPDFHAKLLRGRAVVIGCPKFDDLPAYIDKLAEMIRANALREIIVARMEVPCCTGIVYAVQEAQRRAGVGVQITELVIGTQGEVVAQRPLVHATAGSKADGDHHTSAKKGTHDVLQSV